ncbi:MAG: ATP-dependent DNA ligase [Burkholderiaceae bacterium]|nr:ATP-dependent DNA ligase [Burkholderiaceae bacterium]
MKRFAALYAALDASTATLAKVAALRRYFESADPADAAWAVYFLAGGKPRQTVPSALLRAAACREASLPDWLFEESHQAVGDLAETIAHVLPEADSPSDLGLAHWIEQRLLPLRGQPPAAQADALAAWWRELDPTGRFLLTKLIGGGFRVGVSKLLVQRALAEAFDIDAKVVAQRLMGYTDAKALPTAARFNALHAAQTEVDAGQPYPFFLAHAWNEGAATMAQRLGELSGWLVEWKYDGIRAQVLRREGRCWIWSRGEELMTDRFPEVVAQVEHLPEGTVLDGEILVWLDGAPAPFQKLQQRIGRKNLTKRLLAEAPARFIAYDLLEWQGSDQRMQALSVRRARLEALCADSGLAISPRVQAESWAALAVLRGQSRARGVEGFMLKALDSAYGSGRTKADGTWWKWKVDPLSVDCVLIYAQAGHGRRASVYTDYSFAVWNRPPADAAEAAAVVEAIGRREPAQPGALQLVPFAKAYSGLSDAEFAQVDRVIRAHTLEKFGPVRSVRPTLVFELGFEGVNRSPRHKSGIAVRFPRMLRIRHDKPLHEADSLAQLQALLDGPARSLT